MKKHDDIESYKDLLENLPEQILVKAKSTVKSGIDLPDHITFKKDIHQIENNIKKQFASLLENTPSEDWAKVEFSKDQIKKTIEEIEETFPHYDEAELRKLKSITRGLIKDWMNYIQGAGAIKHLNSQLSEFKKVIKLNKIDQSSE